MAVNAYVDRIATERWSYAAGSPRRLLSRAACTVRGATTRAIGYLAQDAATSRGQRRRAIFEATGRRAGTDAPTGRIAFDLIDRHPHGF